MVDILKTVRTDERIGNFGKFSVGTEKRGEKTTPYLIFGLHVQNYRFSMSGDQFESEKSFDECVGYYPYEIDIKELEEFGKACVKAAKLAKQKPETVSSPTLTDSNS